MRARIFQERMMVLIWAILIAWVPEATGEAQTSVDYIQQIRPILVEHCFKCHSQIKQESSLRLDSIQGMVKGGKRGAAIAPGDHVQSLLFQAIAGVDDLLMPPEGDRLSAEQIALLGRWIDEGAVAPSAEEIARSHWAFRPPIKTELPRADHWVRNPIDAFVAETHQREGLQPTSEAAKERLLRRVYLDLIGLPPRPAEMRAFINDTAPDAYEQVVDRLLVNPRHGERWGRHWMDIWRYSDWAGHKKEVRNSRPHIWRWRDWIVESLNENKPYDRMITEMLAGDEVAPDDPRTLRATGFLVRNWRNWFDGSRNVWLQDTTDHTAKGFLGLTLECARCHDHMYDPITQEDYFRFRAFFEPHEIRTDAIGGQADTTKDGLVRVYDAHLEAVTVFFPGGDDRRPDANRTFLPAPPQSLSSGVDVQPVVLPIRAFYPGISSEIQEAAVDKARAALSAADEALALALARPESTEPEPESRIVEHQLRLAEARQKAAAQDLATVFARIRADKALYGKSESSEGPALIAAAAAAEAETVVLKAEEALRAAELALANAETAPSPDTAAVEQARQKVHTTNAAYLQAVDGRKSPEDYSPLGAKYPPNSTGRRLALAQWITDRKNPLTARVAVNHIWTRHFGRPLVDRVDDFGLRSPPPRMQALLDWLAVELMERDWNMKAIHHLIVTSSLYRMDSAESKHSEANRRLDRDNHYYWRWQRRRVEAEVVRDALLYVSGQLDLTMGGPELDQNAGQTTHRRSIYYRHAREKQMVFLALFDAPNMEECYRRVQTTSPQQGLALFNSPIAIRSARLLAKELSLEKVDAGHDGDIQFVTEAYQRIICRPPKGNELSECLSFLQRQSELLADRDGLSTFSGGAASQVGPAAQPKERARENLLLVLFNLSEFVMMR
jgi:hypothetical protein